MDTKNQVLDYLKSNNLGIGFQELYNLVISKENCTLCGTCTTLCPRIGMNHKEPILLESDPECSTCFKFCPQTYFPEEILEKELFNGTTHMNDNLGHFQKMITAQCTESDVLKVAQNGGLVTTLLIHALDIGLIDGVLLTNKDDKWFPKPVIATTANEIRACAGSKYTIAPSLQPYKDAVNDFKLKKLAFVGMPCQIQAVRKLQLFSPLSKEFGNFTLVIGLYCYSNYSYDLISKFVQGELGLSLNDIKKFDVSNGKFIIFLKNGSNKVVSLKQTKKYSWSSCKYCKDYSAEFADISVGSVGAFDDKWSSVILRTEVGGKVFKEAVKAEKIRVSKDVDLSKMENEARRKKTQISYIDVQTLNSLKSLDFSDFEIKTYTTLLSLGTSSKTTLSKVLKIEEKTIIEVLNKLKQREWVTMNNSSYHSVNPTFVIENEIKKLKMNLLDKISKLKLEALPNLESLYAQNNSKHLRHDENLDLV